MLNRVACWFHLGFWTSAFTVWLAVTIGNHPNWTLRITCTAILVGMSAAYSILWTPRNWNAKHVVASSFALLACGFFTALSISRIYDAVIGPDPRRFSFWTNLWMDTAVLIVNTSVAAAAAWLLGRLSGRSLWSIRSETADAAPTPVGTQESRR